jgi:hypothetical protein
MTPLDAAVEATRRRFRPILMTSIAFILGVVPLLTATGAGSASQQSLGTVVFGGMLASTLLAIPFVPVFYLVMQRVGERFGAARDSQADRSRFQRKWRRWMGVEPTQDLIGPDAVLKTAEAAGPLPSPRLRIQ